MRFWRKGAFVAGVADPSGEVEIQEARKNAARLADDKAGNLIVVDAVACANRSLAFPERVPRERYVRREVVIVLLEYLRAPAEVLFEAGHVSCWNSVA